MRVYMSLLILIPVAIIGVAYALSKQLLADRVPKNVYDYFEATYPGASDIQFTAQPTKRGSQIFDVSFILGGELRATSFSFDGDQVAEIKHGNL